MMTGSFRRWPLVLAASIWAGAAGATSTISDRYNAIYSQTSGCTTCHSETPVANSGNEITGTNTVYGSNQYPKDLANVVPRANNENSSLVEGYIRSIEGTYAPKIRSVGGISYSSTITLGGTTSSFFVDFNEGQSFTGGTERLSLTSPTLPSGMSAGTETGDGITINVTDSAVARGDKRRAGTPYALSFVPVNGSKFKPTSTTNLNNNKVNVQFSNQSPVATNNSYTVAGDAGTKAGNVLTEGTPDYDPDDDDAGILTATLLSGPTGGPSGDSLTLNANGSFTYTFPAGSPGDPADSVTFTYRVTDRERATSNTATVTITLLEVPPAPNVAPVAQDDAFATTEDTTLNGDVLADNGNGVDSDADSGPSPLAVSLKSNVSNGTLTLRTDGTFDYTPSTDFVGTDQFVYVLKDGADTDEGTATITVRNANDPPVVTNAALPAINEEQGEQTINLLDPTRVSDPDGDALTVSNVTVAITAPTLTSPTQSFTVSGGILKFDPFDLTKLDDGESATLVFSFDVSDGIAPAVPGTLTIEVVGVDNGLGRIAGAYANTLRGRYNNHFLTQDEFPASCHSCHNVGQVDADVDDRDDCTATTFNPFGLQLCLARSEGSPPLSDLLRRLSEAESTYAPRLTSVPPLAVSADQPVGALIGAPLPASAGFTVDKQPSRIVDFFIYIAASDTYTDTSADGQFSVSDTGQLSVAGPLTPGTYNLIVLPVNDAGQKDNAGNARPGIPGFFPLQESLVKPITITVTGAQPVAKNDTFNVESGIASALDVLANDTGGATSITITTAPANGTVTVNADLTVSYTSTPGYLGADSFAYTASNAAGTSASATVSLTVAPQGAAIAVDDTFAAFSGQTGLIDVLANDRGSDLSLSIVTPPANGTARVVAGSGLTRVIEYTADAGFVGQDSLTYRASNPLGSTIATVAISVSNVSGDALAAGTQDPELKKVAQALGDTCEAIDGSTADGADLRSICQRLSTDVAGAANIDAALSAIRNEEALEAQEAVMANARATGQTLRTRLRRYRSGGTTGGGIDVSQLNLTFGDKVLPGELLNQLALGFSGVDQGGWNPNIGMFVAGNVTFADRSGDSRRAAVDRTTGNITAGIDFRVSETFAYGFALSFSDSQTDFATGGGLETRSVQLSAYGIWDNWMMQGMTLSGFVTAGVDRFEQARAIAFTAGGVAENRTATADYSGRHLNVALELSYEIPHRLRDDDADKRRKEIQPDLRVFAGLDFLAGQIDGYTETGAGGLNLAVEDQTFESLILTLGIDYTRPFLTQSRRRGEVFARLSANAEVLDRRRTVTSRFAVAGAGGASFTVTEPGRNAVFGDLELGARIPIGRHRGELTLIGGVQFDKDGLASRRLSFGWQTEVFGNDALNLGVTADQAVSQSATGRAEIVYTRRW